MITIQIRDEDLELLHFDIEEHCWESDVIYLNNATYDFDNPDTITISSENIVGITNVETYDFSTWEGEKILIKGTSRDYTITSASYSNVNNEVIITVDLEDDDYIFADDESDIDCQVYGYTSVILDAFETLKDDLLDRGYTLDSLTATSSFRDAQRYKALERIFRQITNDVSEDKWGKLAKEYEQKYLSELANTNIATQTGEINSLGIRIQL